jgi:photosystem II stability/assembly factor-like uncharacterized protein
MTRSGRHALATVAALGALLGLAALPALRVPPVRAAGAPQSGGSIVTSLTLFAGTADGLYRSTDWGRAWKRVEGQLSGSRLEGLGAARALLLLTTQVWVGGNGVFVSDDFGDNWSARAATPGVRALLTSRWPQSDPTVFAGTDQGLLRSRDGGRTFSPTALKGVAVHRVEWPGPALVVACDQGVLVSTDEGGSFSGPGAGLPPGAVRAIVLSSYFAADPVAFAAPESGGVYRSSDGGATWKASGLAGEVVSDFVWLGPFLYAAGENGFHRSQDAGASWSRLSASPGSPRRLLFPLAPAAGLEAFLATGQGLFRTPDAGEHWEPAGFQGSEVLTVGTFPAPEVLLDKRPRR